MALLIGNGKVSRGRLSCCCCGKVFGDVLKCDVVWVGVQFMWKLIMKIIYLN